MHFRRCISMLFINLTLQFIRFLFQLVVTTGLPAACDVGAWGNVSLTMPPALPLELLEFCVDSMLKLFTCTTQILATSLQND